MSYILDALKKSDLQRKQGDVPTLQTVHLPVSPQDKTPRLLYGVIAVLLLLLMFVLGYLFSQQFFQSQDESAIVLPVPAEKARESAEQISSVQPGKVSSNKADPIEADNETSRVAEIQRQSSATEDVSSAVTAPIQHSIENPATASIESSGGRATEAELMDVPYLNELPDYQQQSIPVMEFAGHVYSSDASSRSVIINGQFMEEGDSLMPGLHIESITMNGVVFAYQDILFRVDILQDWSFE
jgi:general secretion pathway protein B